MTRGKWLIMLVIILGLGVLLAGCGGKNEPAKNPAPQDQVAEQPLVEEPKIEEPKKEEPKKEAPVPAPAPASAPASAGPPTLNVTHESRENCAMCHTGGGMLLKAKPKHTIDSNTPTCSVCHKLNFIIAAKTK